MNTLYLYTMFSCYILWSYLFNSICTVHVDTGLVKGQIETNHLSAILSAPYVQTHNSVQIFMSNRKAAGCCYFLPSGQKRLWKVWLTAYDTLKKFPLELKPKQRKNDHAWFNCTLKPFINAHYHSNHSLTSRETYSSILDFKSKSYIWTQNTW